MAQIQRESLISSTNRVEAPFIRIEIAGYTFGVFEEKSKGIGPNGLWQSVGVKYPNYVKSLNVTKINGVVNQYKLSIVYPVTQYDDPNFFEKIFSAASGSRRIIFSYGDFMVPDYIYKNEQAIITKVTVNPGINESIITYNIEAVSDIVLSNASQYSFPATTDKPSNVIKYYLANKKYHLQELFVGMSDLSLVESYNLIADDDAEVDIPTKTNVSMLEYLSFLVSCMIPVGMPKNTTIQNSVYGLSIHEDMTGTFGGPYFKIQRIQSNSASLRGICTYELDIGYPGASIVTNFALKTTDDWSLYYDYNRQASSTDYVKRLNSKGELELMYSPQLTRGSYDLEAYDKSWWTKVTEFPVEAEVTIRGLLRPAMLMNYVKINMWYWGHKYMLSGYYLIAGEVDQIDGNGYRTTLSLIRVAGDEDQMYGSGDIIRSSAYQGDSVIKADNDKRSNNNTEQNGSRSRSESAMVKTSNKLGNKKISDEKIAENISGTTRVTSGINGINIGFGGSGGNSW